MLFWSDVVQTCELVFKYLVGQWSIYMCLLGIRKLLNFCCAVMLHQAVFVVDTAFFMLCFTDTLGCISCSCVI